VLVRKAGRSRASARQAVLSWGDAYPLIETSSSVLVTAMDLAVDHKLSTWDAVILSAAADARCRLLLSENLQEGFTWSGVTVTNPFKKPKHPVLQRLLQP
jgi:predicted nucleic acid-binding protein